ncbi:ninjurin-2 isoform X1 [Piliocolobus tephrosceles]|uniref:Ninjurin 2 n=2 Tax=Piliocolobus tephrosceles TaxID=591936 RepID=A0A8C9LWZ5_9PRIM|nr:ninjurin-2 isoform X1 [Piliocolobus tephrosceles]
MERRSLSLSHPKSPSSFYCLLKRFPLKGKENQPKAEAWPRKNSEQDEEGAFYQQHRTLSAFSSQPGSSDPRRNQPINLNHYATKKSVAESMLDVALFMSNAMRLKAVLEQGPSSHYYITLVTLLSLSLLLQVAIGVLLVVIARLNLNEVEKQWRLNQLNNAATVLVFFTVVVNVFITAFGAHKTGFLTARASRNPL